MKKFGIIWTIVIMSAVIMGFVATSFAEPMWKKRVKGKLPEMQSWASNKVVVEAVKNENAKNKSLADIKAMDQKWKSSKGIPDFIKNFLTNECGQYLTKVKKENSFVGEIFVMDNKGAIVAESDKTSDYWQGDEDKWQKSFNGGNGQVFIDKREYDRSSGIYMSQISIPVLDENKKTIGAMTIGCKLSRKHYK